MGSDFLSGDDEVPVPFQLAFDAFPPLLPVIRDDVRNQDLLDLVDGGRSAEALEHQLDQLMMLERRHLAQPRQIRRLSREDVVDRNRLECFHAERQVHRMPRPRRKIDQEPGEYGVDRGDFSESPAAMGAEAALNELQQRINMLSSDLASGHQLLQLFSHTGPKSPARGPECGV